MAPHHGVHILKVFFYDGLEICGIIADTNLIMVAEHVIGVNGFA